MDEDYRGVHIRIIESSQPHEHGKFILSWANQAEEVVSQWKQAARIITQAREFVDAWLEDGYITLE